MFIGKGRAGKTSTIRSLLNLDFNENEVSTAVADAEGQIKVTTTNVVVNNEWTRQPKTEHANMEDFKITLKKVAANKNVL